MRANNNKNIPSKSRGIKFNCLILTAIILSLGISSCVTPRSVRGGKFRENQADAQNTPTQDIKEEVIANDDIEAFYNKIAAAKVREDNSTKAEVTSDPAEAETPDPNIIASIEAEAPKLPQKGPDRIPTLREQLKSLKKGQGEISTKVTNIYSEMDEIKDKIKLMQSSIKDLQKRKPIATKKTKKRATSSAVILPDEVIKKPKKTKPSKTSNAPRTNVTISQIPVVNTKQTVKQKPKSKSNKLQTSEELYTALNDIKNQNYDQAIEKLLKIVGQQKDAVQKGYCNYWIGESHFELENYDEAVKYFVVVVNSPQAKDRDKAQDLIAESCMRSGRIPKAKEAYSDLIKKFPKSRYVPRALKMMQQL